MSSSLFEIPKHWKWVILDDIGIVVSGGTPSTKEPEFWNGDIPWITPADLSNHNEVYISKGSRNISQVGLEYSSAYLLPANSVVFSSRAPIGYVAITKNELATNQGFKNLILPSELVNPKYVYYYLKTVKELAENMASGTTFLELSTTKFRQIPIPLAPIEEQNSIVEKIEELFSELDKSIDNLQIAKTKTGRNIYSIYNQIFNKNILGKVSYIRQICTINYGKSLIQKQRIKGDIPVYGSNGIIDYHNNTYLEKPVIIIGRKGSVGELHFSDKKCYPIDTTYYIEEDESFNLKFLFYQLQTKNLQQLSKATTIPGLNREHIYDLKVVMPSVEDQELIVKYIDEKLNDNEILSKDIDSNINMTKSLYLKILQEAFHGKLILENNKTKSVMNLAKHIKEENDKYLSDHIEKSKIKKMVKREKKNLLNILTLNFNNNTFYFDDIIQKSAMSINVLEEEFNSLLIDGKISKIYDKKSKSIKFKIS